MFGVTKHEHEYGNEDHEKHHYYMSAHSKKNRELFSLTQLSADNGATFPAL